MNESINIYNMAVDLTLDENVLLKNILEDVDGDIESSMNALCDGEYLESISINQNQTENIYNYLNELKKCI